MCLWGNYCIIIFQRFLKMDEAMEALLKQLETKIRALLESTQQLSDEKDLLLNKQKQAISQIENLISKLKTIEKTQ
jgi:hypothetical protein